MFNDTLPYRGNVSQDSFKILRENTNLFKLQFLGICVAVGRTEEDDNNYIKIQQL